MQRIAVVWGVALCVLTHQVFAVGVLADVTVYDRTSGQLLPVYSADGQRYVAGQPGNEYEVRVRNNSGDDILAVVSVDGVNVVTGETAATSQSGYVIGVASTMSISGWRKSLSRIARFYFTDHSDAYATRTGRPHDVGVIGVAVFKRKRVPSVDIQQPPQPQVDREEMHGKDESSTGARQGARPSAVPAPRAAEGSIGTGHGSSETSYARYVEFERESDLPNELIAIRYDTRNNLLAHGIIREPMRTPGDPNPFPARFVPDPPRRW